jgi:hypothetical protein
MICLLVGIPLVDLDVPTAQATRLWMLPYGFPIIFNSISIILLLVFFREDSILFLVEQGECKKSEAIRAIERVYVVNNPDPDCSIDEVEVIYEQLKADQLRAAGDRAGV